MSRREENKQGREEEAASPGAETINLSEREGLRLNFTNGRGQVLFTFDFSRDVEEKPQATINVYGKSGNMQSALTMFDVDAPLARRWKR